MNKSIDAYPHFLLTKEKFILIAKVIAFYFCGSIWVSHLINQYLVNPLMHSQSLAMLDYGRLGGRIAKFLSVILVYSFFAKFIDHIGPGKNLFFPNSSIIRYFLYGVILGSIMMIATTASILLFNSAVISLVPHWRTQLLPTVTLYFFAQLMTGTTEELILRGYALSHLFKIMNPHAAILLTASLFGYLHLQYSALYAAMAFCFGILAGYGFLWTKNLYFPIGFHFSWNFIESVCYSHSLVHITIRNALWVGDKNITPDREGLWALIFTVIGMSLLLCWGKKYLTPSQTTC